MCACNFGYCSVFVLQQCTGKDVFRLFYKLGELFVEFLVTCKIHVMLYDCMALLLKYLKYSSCYVDICIMRSLTTFEVVITGFSMADEPLALVV